MFTDQTVTAIEPEVKAIETETINVKAIKASKTVKPTKPVRIIPEMILTYDGQAVKTTSNWLDDQRKFIPFYVNHKIINGKLTIVVDKSHLHEISNNADNARDFSLYLACMAVTQVNLGEAFSKDKASDKGNIVSAICRNKGIDNRIRSLCGNRVKETFSKSQTPLAKWSLTRGFREGKAAQSPGVKQFSQIDV